MSPKINIADDLYQILGEYGNRNESWNTVLLRLKRNADEDAIYEDKRKRRTIYTLDNRSRSDGANRNELQQLVDGTTVRHCYKRGPYSGEIVTAEIRDGCISYMGTLYDAPSGAAAAVDKDHRGDDATHHNGWTWWKYHDEARNGWVPLDVLRG